MGRPPRQTATHTGTCTSCDVRYTLNPSDGMIRGHQVEDGVGGFVDCAGAWRAPAAGSVQDRATRRPASAPHPRLSPVERRLREFPCTYCRAKVGEPCVSLVRPQRAANTHTNRFVQATAAGRLPLTDAELAREAGR